MSGREGAAIRVGVLGASRIVKQALLDASPGLVEVNAIAARDMGRARAFADEHDIPRAYGSYAELLDDTELDAVYVALPASAHALWAERALRKGKHVLCEKPFGLCVAEALACVETASQCDRVLMEAHHWRYHALVPLVEEALAELGAIESVASTFRVGLNNPGDIRLNPLLGAGVLMDFGCYLIQWSLWAARSAGVAPDASPLVESSRVTEAESGVDVEASGVLRLGGVPLTFDCDMRDGVDFEARIVVTARDATVTFENPLALGGSHLRVVDRATGEEKPRCGPQPEAETTYRRQLRTFCDAIQLGTEPLTAGSTLLETQSVLDEIYRMAGLPNRLELREKHSAQ